MYIEGPTPLCKNTNDNYNLQLIYYNIIHLLVDVKSTEDAILVG